MEQNAMPSRRKLLSSIGVAAVSTIGYSTAANAGDSENDFTHYFENVPQNAANIELARSVKWLEVVDGGSGYVKVQSLPSKLPNNFQEAYSDLSQPQISPEEVVGPNMVTLGVDTSFTDAQSGNAWGGHSGDIVGNGGSSYDTAADRAMAAAIAAGGLGEIRQHAWIGIPFTVDGSGDQDATVTISGTYTGGVLAAGSGSTSATITVILKNQSSGALYPNEIYHISGDLAKEKYFTDKSYSGSVTPTLRGGETYMAYTKIDASVSASGACDVSSDFGPGDGDNGSQKQGIVLNYVDINF